MDIKKLILTCITIATLSCTVNVALAGQTTITGTMSCVMPDMFEYKTQAADTTAKAKVPTDQAQADSVPIPAGASGNYEVQKEDKLIQTEQTIAQKDSKEGQQVTVYTICAK